MENQEENCEKLIKRWRELKLKLPKAQRIIPGKDFQAPYISPEERDEFYEITKKIKDKCLSLGLLSPLEKHLLTFNT